MSLGCNAQSQDVIISEHRATVEWQRSGEFRYETYSRAHALHFDAIEVRGNAAPGNIPSTVKHEAGVDPEQTFVAALSSCHTLWFLTFAGKAPSEQEHRALHHRAHEKCFIANSVKTQVLVEPC